MRKRIIDPWKSMLAGHDVRTPYGRKLLDRRAAAKKVAKQARKVSRRFKATGGKK